MTEISASPAPAIAGAASQAGLSRSQERWLVLVLTMMGMLAAVDRQILALLVNPIKADLQLSDVQISLVIGAAFALANIAFTLPAGYIADTRRARALIAGGGWAWSAMTVGCGMTSNFVQLFAARAGVGAGEAAIMPGALAILRKGIPPERRGRAFSIFYMSLMIGAALALLAGGLLVGAIERNHDAYVGWLGDVSPWRIALFIVGGLGIPISALMFTLKIPTTAADATTATPEAISYRTAFGHIARNRRLYGPLWVSNIAFMLMTAAFAGWLAAMTQRKFGLSAQETGLALGSAMLIMPQVGLFVSGRLIDRTAAGIGMRGVAVVGALGTVGYWLGTALVPQMQAQAAFFGVLWISLAFSQAPMPAYATLLSSFTPPELMGKITSIQLILLGVLGTVIGPTLVAFVAERVFSGPEAIANALSLVAFSVGWIPMVGLLFLRRALRSAAR